MRLFAKAGLGVLAMAALGLGSATPANAQSFGFSFGTGPYGGYYGGYYGGGCYYGNPCYRRPYNAPALLVPSGLSAVLPLLLCATALLRAAGPTTGPITAVPTAIVVPTTTTSARRAAEPAP